MRRVDMHTGDLVAWRDFKDGYADPGVIIIPKPVDTQYGGRYKLATRGGTQYLLLSIKEHEEGRAVRRILDGRVEVENATMGSDFWGVGTTVLEHADILRERLEDGEVVSTEMCPKNWTLSRVTASLIRGPYVEHHRIDAAKRRQLAERNAEENARRETNKARLEKIMERLLARELPSGFTDRVRFRAWNPADPEPLVDVPLPLLELLLDDGER